MSIKIHYGANGSYKTSGAVWDDVVPAIKEGRTVITNIRGLSEARCREQFPDAPASFKLISIDLDSEEGLERCRTWFRWAPKGALIIFDETQLIFLTSWRDKYLERFDYPGGPEAAKAADVPSGWLDAWTRHRHWNWDIVLTTPNIRYVRADIRRTSEGAFKHTNFALLGPIAKTLLGDYKEVFHDAQLNNPPPKAIGKLRRIDKRVFKLYDSTATGKAQDTRAGTSIFASIPLLVGIGVITLAAVIAFSGKGVTGWFRPSLPKPAAAPVPAAVASTAPAADSPRQLPADAVADRPVTQADLIGELFKKYAAYFVGKVIDPRGVPVFWIAFFDKQGAQIFQTDSAELGAYGFNVAQSADCMLTVASIAKGVSQFVLCRPPAPVDHDKRPLDIAAQAL